MRLSTTLGEWMRRGQSKSFPAFSNDPKNAGWYEASEDPLYVRYWSGNEWDPISFEKKLSWWMIAISAILWWSNLLALVIGLTNRPFLLLFLCLAVLLSTWILYVSWALHLPIHTVLWRTVRCMTAATV